jgi:pSer/pThr/pTyr-binding forkhead associated (FHA) protein
MLTLVLKEGANPVTYNLDEDVITIGRSKENNIVLKNIKASRRHARIERTGAVYQITDLGSGNGTKVNGGKIDIHALKKGEEIKIGDAVITVKAIDEGVDAMDVDDGGDELKIQDDSDHKLGIVGDDSSDKDTEKISWSEQETEVQAPAVKKPMAKPAAPAGRPSLNKPAPGKPGAAPAKPLMKKPLGRQGPK